jgi:hypothetical protein
VILDRRRDTTPTALAAREQKEVEREERREGKGSFLMSV